MPKRTEAPAPRPPSISQEEGKRRLELMRSKGKAMLEQQQPLQESALNTWADTTLEYIKQTFGSNSPHARNFATTAGGVVFVMGGGSRYDDGARRRQNDLRKYIECLDSIIEVLDTEIGFSTSAPAPVPQQVDFWPSLHPDVVQHSKSRFDAGHFADSVEAAFKHINTKVKDLVLRKTSKELDGASLMRTAFSPNSPVICLDDLNTESGRNIQQGYMDIFAGGMIGIRNPKAHGNIQIDSKRAVHLLFLASLLLYKLDERI